jgi:hypothetical protein
MLAYVEEVFADFFRSLRATGHPPAPRDSRTARTGPPPAPLPFAQEPRPGCPPAA